jgi:hypothetical protein
MKHYFKKLWLLALVFAFRTAKAQDSLSLRDATEIRYKAGNMVGQELRDLLNAISSTAFETQEIADVIHGAYSEGRNRIFRDSAVDIEPDINPTFQTGAQSGDEPLEKYLKDLDILYKKSDSSTIGFSNIRTSNVKKKDIVYVKVYFNAFFKGGSTVNDQAYVQTNRIAEVEAMKDKNQWKVYIVRLGFLNPADTTGGDVTNNIPLKVDVIAFQGLTAKSTEAD